MPLGPIKAGRSTFLSLCLVFYSLPCFALPDWLAVEPMTIPVEEEVRKQWMNDIFGVNEFWIIEDRSVFFELLRRNRVPAPLIEEIKGEVQALLPFQLVGVATSIYGAGGKKDGFLLNVDGFKELLPERALKSIYNYLDRTGLGPPTLTMPTLDEAHTVIKEWSLPYVIEKHALKSVFPSGEKYFIPITPLAWKHLPDDMKEQFIETVTGMNDETRQGLSLQLKITPETDLTEVAEVFSGGRNPQVIQRFLERKRRQHPQRKPRVLVEEILPPFARNFINQFHSVGGPNCFNCAVSFNEGHHYDQTYIGEPELLRVLQEKYEPLDPQASLQTGDILAYKDRQGQVIHVATHVIDNIVFTKNGITKFNPYMYQKREVNEAVYAKGMRLFVEAYRFKGDGRAQGPSSGCQRLF